MIIFKKCGKKEMQLQRNKKEKKKNPKGLVRKRRKKMAGKWRQEKNLKHC